MQTDKLRLKKPTINSLLTSLIYPKKEITQDAILYKFIKFTEINKERLTPNSGCFKDPELSCDWNKYSTAEQTRHLISKQFIHNTTEFKNYKEYFVCKLQVKKILDLDPKQTFVHDPIFHFPTKIGSPNNRAHSLIVGNKDNSKDKLKARGQLAMRSEWAIFDEDEFKNLLLNR